MKLTFFFIFFSRTSHQFLKNSRCMNHSLILSKILSTRHQNALSGSLLKGQQLLREDLPESRAKGPKCKFRGHFQCLLSSTLSFTVGSNSKESTCNAGDLGSMPGLERSPGEGNSYTLQFSCLENPMDRGA